MASECVPGMEELVFQRFRNQPPDQIHLPIWHEVLKGCYMHDAGFIPPAWDYNPSTWPQRIPLVVVALIGFCIAMYLGYYQLGIVANVWDPFFGNGSENVLHSKISGMLPIPDALLGALGYLMDVVTGIIGGIDRWKTKPWIVIIFGIAVGPLGLVSILLVISQPIIVGSWCTLCLCSAVISVMMISPAMDEMLASLQYLQRVKRSNRSVWKAFWGSKEISDQIQ